MPMSNSWEDLRERFQRCSSALEGKGLKVNVRKTKLLVSGTNGKIVLSRMYQYRCSTSAKPMYG